MRTELKSRLKKVLELLPPSDVVYDIGCDHGYLSAALILSGRAKRVVASDISPASVEKARALSVELGIEDRMLCLSADGLEPVQNAAGDYSIAVCGMGGELILRLIESSRKAAEGASLIVMQPMRGEAELRRYLFENGFGITDECVAFDDGRYYQITAARHGLDNSIPEGFPKDWFRFGWVMANKRDENLLKLLYHYRSVYKRELEKARRSFKDPEPLRLEIERTEALIDFIGGSENQCF